MKITYTGLQNELPAKIQKKLDAKFAKLSRLLDGKGEHKAHVIVTQERHLFRGEITIHFYDHQLVALGSDADLFTALSTALDKLDAQAVKQRSKWREKKRRNNGAVAIEETPAAPEAPAQRVYRVNLNGRRKPMTLEEAMIEIGDRNYIAYRDADRECVSVLVRRSDGHFDLIES